jgi:hypothetical protein
MSPVKFMSTVKGDVREYKFQLAPRGYGFQLEMAKRGYTFKERITSKETGMTYDVYIREEKL